MGLRESFWKKLGVVETGEKGVNTGNEDNNSQFREIVVRNNGKAEREIVPIISKEAVEGEVGYREIGTKKENGKIERKIVPLVGIKK